MALHEDSEIKLKKEKEKLPKKIVVRKLPPTFTREDFLTVVQPLADHNYFSFIIADRSLGAHAYSRAYINFTNQEDVFIFRDQFDGYVFVDQKGNEYPAIVEYAPFPKIPKQTKQRADPRCGTIDKDEDYTAFLEMLKEENSGAVPQIEAMLEEIEKEERLLKASSGNKTKTPLLEYIEQRASDRQKIIEKRRKKELDRKKSREEERKKRKEMAKKREEAYREEREKLRQRREQKEKSKKDFDNDKETRGESTGKESKPRDTVDKKTERSHNRHEKSNDSAPLKTKRYSEVRKREDRDKRSSKIEIREASEAEATPESSKFRPETSDTVDRKQNLSEEILELAVEKQTDEFREESSDRKHSSKDFRSERRIKNKDRPDMQLYRPGQSRLKSSTKTSGDTNEADNSSSSSSPVCPESRAAMQKEDSKTEPKTDRSDKPEDSDCLEREDISARGNRKGYSYLQERESRRNSAKNKEESSQFKSKTFRRTGQE